MANPHVQGSDDIIIQASPQAVYKILTDGSLLPQWMPPVLHTTAGIETVGCIRMWGKNGRPCGICGSITRCGMNFIAAQWQQTLRFD